MPGFVPGRYIILTVSDDGMGMSQQVQARIFEPFFTTKPLGKGTGLGLAMVYGIVKQSGGYIRIDSELDRGTTVQIFFPAVDEAVSAAEIDAMVPVQGQGETILLAEDEDALRESIAVYLKKHGYQVLAASNGDEALQVAEQYSGKIHLLLTDVVMPKMEGAELARELAKLRPDISTLFMSGYTDHRSLELAAGDAPPRCAAEAAESADSAGNYRRNDETELLSLPSLPVLPARLKAARSESPGDEPAADSNRLPPIHRPTP